MFLLGGLGGGVGLTQSVLEPLRLVPLLIKGVLRSLSGGPGLVSLHPGAGQLCLIDLRLSGKLPLEPLSLLPESAGLILGGHSLFFSLVPRLECLVQLPDAHVLHVILKHKLLPLVLVRDHQEAQRLGERQTPKRLGFCLAAEQALLVAPILTEHPHKVLRLGGGVIHLVLQILAPAPVGQLGLGLRQPPPNLDGGVEHHPAGLRLDRADLRRKNIRRLTGVHRGKGRFRGGRRTTYPKVLTEELALS